ncbi:hypothetical protein QFC20_001945 [Naganishia adeliensis]|uniref:Uncharacterized protein n=1 Tax=Naganishia adeliensis TaxID=92952 RepID=A0ACC2WQ46_9TREE|nr:hypothetical protein QFC20_001945 [Naganishia adeliensis]
MSARKRNVHGLESPAAADRYLVAARPYVELVRKALDRSEALCRGTQDETDIRNRLNDYRRVLDAIAQYTEGSQSNAPVLWKNLETILDALRQQEERERTKMKRYGSAASSITMQAVSNTGSGLKRYGPLAIETVGVGVGPRKLPRQLRALSRGHSRAPRARLPSVWDV